MNVTPINRINSLVTGISMTEPLNNLLTESPSLVAMCAVNSLTFTANCSHTVDALTFINTNADKITIDPSKPGLVEEIVNGDFAEGAENWNHTAEWSFSNGLASVTSTTFGELWQDAPSGISVGDAFTIVLIVHECTQGTLYQIGFGGTHFDISIGATGTYTYTGAVTDASVGLLLYNESDFNGSIDSVSVIVSEIVHGTPIVHEFNGVNSFGESPTPWERQVQLPVSGDYTTFETTLDGDASIYLGAMWAGKRLQFDHNPNYGMALTVKPKEVQIPYSDGSVYRRYRQSARVFSGDMVGMFKDSGTILMIQEISRRYGTKPMPWVLVDSRCKETLVYGGLIENNKKMMFFNYDDASFTVMEEI